MKNQNPLVSVIIPTFNRKQLVCNAVASVLAQTYRNIECIVVDDHSTDNTLESLTELSKQDSRLRLISHLENRHLSAARNTGIEASFGELIAFLDDDDIWLPEKLEKQVKLLLSTPPEVGFVYCWFDKYRDSKIVGTRRPKLKGYIFDDLLVSQPLGNGSTLLVRREVIDKIGGFDENLKRGIDGDFIRRVGQYYEIEVVPEVLVHYFIDHGGSARITSSDYQGILNDIHCNKINLEKFASEFEKRPKQHTALLFHLSRRYAKIGNFSDSFKMFISALHIKPFNSRLLIITLKIVIKDLPDYFRIKSNIKS